jgi:hypothetical protein
MADYSGSFLNTLKRINMIQNADAAVPNNGFDATHHIDEQISDASSSVASAPEAIVINTDDTNTVNTQPQIARTQSVVPQPQQASSSNSNYSSANRNNTNTNSDGFNQDEINRVLEMSRLEYNEIMEKNENIAKTHAIMYIEAEKNGHEYEIPEDLDENTIMFIHNHIEKLREIDIRNQELRAQEIEFQKAIDADFMIAECNREEVEEQNLIQEDEDIETSPPAPSSSTEPPSSSSVSNLTDAERRQMVRDARIAALSKK